MAFWTSKIVGWKTKFARLLFVSGLLGFLLFSGCAKEKVQEDKYAFRESPVQITIPHFPAYSLEAGHELSAEKIAVGKKLFFDPIISRNRDISCASCHLPHLAFSDGLATSVGTEGRVHNRNSPTLFNVLWQPYLFMDGGNPTLESQVVGPIEEHREMDLPFTEAIARVAANETYQNLFKWAFNDDVNPFTFSLALASYERSLVSYNSAFDRFYYQGDSLALNASAQRGLALFKSAELKCADCHQLPLTTDFSFQNNGLKEVYLDPGRARVTNNLAEHEGQFKVATLRNITLTAPYMHDGSLASLEEVIEHYASGGSNHPLKSEKIKGFAISASEKADLLEFLKSLEDTSSYQQYQFDLP